MLDRLDLACISMNGKVIIGQTNKTNNRYLLNSSAFVFQKVYTVFNANHILRLTFIFNFSLEQGIDKIKNKTELIQKFTPCMNKAHSLIPENRKNRTKISLAATAGMRLLT
jgi:hypothetical protein